jgi:hypothetical protein
VDLFVRPEFNRPGPPTTRKKSDAPPQLNRLEAPPTPETHPRRAKSITRIEALERRVEAIDALVVKG